MTHLIQMAARWTGFIGDPGYSNFYAESAGNADASAQSLSDAVHDLFANVSGLLPGSVSINVPPEWREFDDVDGETIAEGTADTPAVVVVGSSGAGYAANSGVLVEWMTGAFIAGHRLRGRTYLVPMVGCFDDDGTLSAVVKADLTNWCNAFLADNAANVVWHRPVNGAGGTSALITNARVSDTAAVLRSRGK